jgi:hypothetical protein
MNLRIFILLLLGLASCQDMYGKIYAGYQGWFSAPGDGTPFGGNHWKIHRERPFAVDNANLDYWPETDEYEKKYPVPEFGNNYYYFSAYDYSTVNTHFRWMR